MRKLLTDGVCWVSDLKVLWITTTRPRLAKTIRQRYCGLRTVTCASYAQAWYLPCGSIESAREVLWCCDAAYRQRRENEKKSRGR